VLGGDARRAEPGRGGPAPDRQAAGNRQHRHVGGVIVGSHQPAAEPPGTEVLLQLGHRVTGGDGMPPARRRAGDGHRQREPDRLAGYPGAGQPGPGEMVAPVAAGQLMHHLQAPAAHRVGRRPADGPARRVAAYPAGEGVEDLAHEFHPRAGAPQVEPEFWIHRKRLPLARVQGVGGQLAHHRYPVVDGLRVEGELTRHSPEQTARDARAGWVPRQHPYPARTRLHPPQPVFHIGASGLAPVVPVRALRRSDRRGPGRVSDCGSVKHMF
jgi:hypothetical protein